MGANSDVEMTMSLQFDQINSQLGKINTKMNGFGVGAAKATKKAQKGIDGLSSKLKGLAIGYVSLATAQKAWQITVDSARGSDAIKIFETTGMAIESLREATDGLFSTVSLAKKANLARTMGINTESFIKMSKVAAAAAKSTGESVDFMLDSIIKGNARESKLILDNLGLMVSKDKAQARFIKMNGIVGRSLTDVEKKQAFINMAMEGGNELLDQAAASGANAAEDFEKLIASSEDLTQAIGVTLQPSLRSLARALTSVARAYEWILDGQSKMAAKEARESMTAKQQKVFTDGIIAARRRLVAEFGSLEAAKKAARRERKGERIVRSGMNMSTITADLEELAELELRIGDNVRKVTGQRSRAQAKKDLARKKADLDEAAKAQSKADKRAWKKRNREREARERKAEVARNKDLRAKKKAAQEAVELRNAAIDKALYGDFTSPSPGSKNKDGSTFVLEDPFATQREAELEWIKKKPELEREAIRQIESDKKAAHKADMARRDEATDQAALAISIGVDLAAAAGQMLIEQDKKIMEKLVALGLQRVGSELVAKGSLLAAEGLGLAIMSHGTDPAAYAAMAQGGVMVAGGLAMGAGSAAITHSLGGGGGRSSDAIGSRAAANRGNGTENVGASGGVKLTINYGVSGPHPDATAKAVVDALSLARRRNMVGA